MKQSPKQWHEKFDNVIIRNGFIINGCDKCVYSKKFEKEYVLVCLYVDDILILGTNIDVINRTNNMLTNNFDMKDMGEADLIIRMKISRTSDGIFLWNILVSNPLY